MHDKASDSTLVRENMMKDEKSVITLIAQWKRRWKPKSQYSREQKT
jgi:hypothetical protein